MTGVDPRSGAAKERRRDVEHAAVRVLSEADTLDAALGPILQGICDALEWRAGTAWLVDEGEKVLRCVEFWSDDRDLDGFARRTVGYTFGPSIGLPGQVWVSGEPGWIPDVSKDTNFPRASEVASLGLHAAIGFPIVVRGRVTGVLEFFSYEILPPDDDLMAMLGAIGIQIGQFVERKQAQDLMRESEARKSAVLEAVPDAIVTIDLDGVILEWNRAAERMFGYGAEDALGLRMAELIVPLRLREQHEFGLARFRETGRTTIVGRRVEFPVLRADGTEITCDIKVSRVHGGGKPAFTALLRDITQRRKAEDELRLQKAILQSEIEATVDGVLVLGQDGRVQYANQRLIDLWGIPSSALESTSHLEILWHMVNQLEDPERFLEQTVYLQDDTEQRDWTELRIKDGRVLERWTAPLLGPNGERFGRAWGFRDVTERKEAEQLLLESQRRMAFRADIAGALARSLDPRSALQAFADLIVPRLADWCSIHLVTDGRIEPVAVAHTDPAKVRLARELTERYPVDPDAPHGVAHVVRTGEVQLTRHVDEALIQRLARDAEHLEFIRSLGFTAALTVPLAARDRVFGAVSLINAESGRSFTDADQRFVLEIAQQAALHVDNARLYEERAVIARSLQKSLLPPHLPTIKGLDIAARYHPAREGMDVGGDFYDIFQTGRDRWVVVVGDVAGKGPAAASVSGLARFTLRGASMSADSPEAVLGVLNESLLQQTEADMFCTAVYTRIELQRKGAIATIACAGHPTPYLLRSIFQGGQVETVPCKGTMLGVTRDFRLTQQTIELTPGDTLVLYTDGVIEARNGERTFGQDGLEDLVERLRGLDAQTIAERIEREALALQGEHVRDDVAIFVLRIDL
jgi:PAS domain S-box-containing protein